MQETLYIGQWCLSPLQSRHLGASHSSPNCHQLPSHISLNPNDGLKISSLSKVILFLEKARSHRVPNLGWRRAESPGWFDVLPKKFMRHDAWVGVLWWNCQSLVVHSCGLLNHPNSFHTRMFKLTIKLDADMLLYLLSNFDTTATLYT